MSAFTRLARPHIIPAPTKSSSLDFVFDLESDALLDKATTVHCVVIADFTTDQIHEYGPGQIQSALAHLARADRLIGQNIVDFDLPLLQRLYGWAPAPNCIVADTLIASRLILPHITDLDDQAAAMGDCALGKLRGRYSLEAWGVRLDIPKVGTDIEDWSVWTPEMQERCVGDVAITKALFWFLQPDGYSQQALELEHRVAAICDRIVADGVPFDIAAAEQLRRQWAARRAELEAQLSQQFPGTNLNSRQQIGALLEVRGWVPEERTEKTKQPKIDDELLESIPELYPEFAGLAEHYTLGRRLGQLSNGEQAWCKNVGSDGRIHGGLVHIGTPHSRAKHLQPNLAQVPNQKKGKPFAAECRALFRASNDWVFVTCDQAALQDRGFAHYLHDFDGGAYARAFLAGVDMHWKNAVALDLIHDGMQCDKENKLHTTIREGAKTFRYAFLFGCYDKRAGQIIASIARDAHRIDSNNDLLQRFFGGAAHPSETTLKRVGKQARDKFMAATPGLTRLRANLEAQVHKHGWLPGLDGRRIPARAQYSALNFIVTASEAVICKRWLVNVYDELHARFRYGWNGDVAITLWVHDEIACCCRPEIAEQVGEILVRHAKKAGEFYGFKVPLDAEYKIGRSWAGEVLGNARENKWHTGTEPEIVAAAPSNKSSAAKSSETTEALNLGIGSGPNVELATAEIDNSAPAQHDAGTEDPLDELLNADRHNGDLDHHSGDVDDDDGGGHNDSDDRTGHDRPPWTTPTLTEVLPGPELEAIVAATSAEDRALVRPPKANEGAPQSETTAPPHTPPPPPPSGGPKPNGRSHYSQSEHNQSERGQLVAQYVYLDAAGCNYLLVKRYEWFVTSANGAAEKRKSFPQYRWTGSQWLKGCKGLLKIPFHLPELLAAPRDALVAICAGEKDVLTMAQLGYVATCNPGGEIPKAWTPELNCCFVGRPVLIVEDNDDTGRAHTREVAQALSGMATSIKVLQFPDVPEHEDVTWWLEHDHTKDELDARIAAAPLAQREGYVLVRASDIVPRRMEWLWQGHILRGSQELLTGVPGGGKSQIHCAFAAYVTTSRAWPDGCNGMPPGNVIMLTAEDCLDHTIVPRLIAADANLDRIFILRKIRKDNKERIFLLNEDLEELERVIRDTGDVGLITIDPITAYMGGKVDSHRATDVRGQLGPLADLAERMDVALSAITHPPKHSTQRAIDHFIGSQAFIAAARIGHMAIEEVDDDEHGNRTPTGRSLFTNAKNNVSRKMPTLAYRVAEKQLAGEIKAPYVIWEEIVDITADQAVAAATLTKRRQTDGVVMFLLNILANGPVPVSIIEERATACGFSKDQLDRAKKKMGIVTFKQKGKLEGQWFWALPQHAATPDTNPNPE